MLYLAVKFTEWGYEAIMGFTSKQQAVTYMEQHPNQINGVIPVAISIPGPDPLTVGKEVLESVGYTVDVSYSDLHYCDTLTVRDKKGNVVCTRPL